MINLTGIGNQIALDFSNIISVQLVTSSKNKFRLIVTYYEDNEIITSKVGDFNQERAEKEMSSIYYTLSNSVCVGNFISFENRLIFRAWQILCIEKYTEEETRSKNRYYIEIKWRCPHSIRLGGYSKDFRDKEYDKLVERVNNFLNEGK